jgi:hypothetical protein
VTSATMLYVSPYTGAAISPVWGTAAAGAVVGVPVAAGLSSQPKKKQRIEVAVSPTFTPKYKGISLAARF